VHGPRIFRGEPPSDESLREKIMLRTFIALLALGFVSSAAAQVGSFADIKAKGGVQLTSAELSQLMPGAKVVSRTPQGSTRHWENKPDGTFVASSDSRGSAGGRTVIASGNGTWKVTDNDRLCVAIQWNRTSEDWCRYMFKVDQKYYGVGKLDDAAVANEFEFSK
jgi:hypothetical protein